MIGLERARRVEDSLVQIRPFHERINVNSQSTWSKLYLSIFSLSSTNSAMFFSSILAPLRSLARKKSSSSNHHHVSLF